MEWSFIVLDAVTWRPRNVAMAAASPSSRHSCGPVDKKVLIVYLIQTFFQILKLNKSSQDVLVSPKTTDSRIEYLCNRHASSVLDDDAR
jgi:hypothetical protein